MPKLEEGGSMTDIVQQLHDLYRSHPVVMQAADEIERLRTLERQLAEAREVIRPFAEIADRCSSALYDDERMLFTWALPTVGEFRRAREWQGRPS
jgi:hypothetical protein